MKHLTTGQVIVRIAIIVSVVEMSFMLFLERSKVLHSIDERLIAPINVILLVGITTPLIYFLVIKPFIVARDDALEQLRHLAFTDPLTQLPNRRPLLLNLDKFLENCDRHNEHGALFLLDLDGFKFINDKHGHDVGDAVLVEFSRRLQKNTRSGEMVGRFGGDEFLVLVDHLDDNEDLAKEQVEVLANTLIHVAQSPFVINGLSLSLGISIGVRLLGFEKLAKDVAVSEADQAMYKAKGFGKSCMVIFE